VKRIELIGASGVGKSTLYTKLNQIPKSQRRYLVLKEAFKSAALNCEISIKQPNIFLYQQVLKYNLFKRKEHGLGKVILQNREKGIGDDRDRYNKFSVSFDILYHFLKDETNPFFIKTKLLWFLRKVDDYLLLEKYLPGNDFVIIDEGMLHYHAGFTDYALQTYNKDQLKNDPAFNLSGIIYCIQSEKKIFEQALKRKESGVITFSHGLLSREELREYVSLNALQNKLKAKRFINHGIPLLEIDTMEDFKHITVRINDFVASLDK